MGDKFKLVVENGRQYVVSERYPILKDKTGNENNVYNPSDIKMGRNERKRERPINSGNPYDIQAINTDISNDLISEKTFAMSDNVIATTTSKLRLKTGGPTKSVVPEFSPLIKKKKPLADDDYEKIFNINDDKIPLE